MMEALHSSETSVRIGPHGVTSQRTAFFIVTAVKISLVIKKLCKIWSFHGGDFECRLLGCYPRVVFAACLCCQLLLTLFLARRFLSLWWRRR
jgi:hypothetical protein